MKEAATDMVDLKPPAPHSESTRRRGSPLAKVCLLNRERTPGTAAGLLPQTRLCRVYGSVDQDRPYRLIYGTRVSPSDELGSQSFAITAACRR